MLQQHQWTHAWLHSSDARWRELSDYSVQDMKDLLTAAQFDQYLESSLVALLEATDTFLRCPNKDCNVPIEVVVSHR